MRTLKVNVLKVVSLLKLWFCLFVDDFFIYKKVHDASCVFLTQPSTLPHNANFTGRPLSHFSSGSCLRHSVVIKMGGGGACVGGWGGQGATT